MTTSTYTPARFGPLTGAATTFPFAFKVLDPSHLIVTRVAADGAETTLVLGVGFTATGIGSDSGSITTTATYPDGYLVVSREVPITQTTKLRGQSAFYPEIHEDAFDKLTMIAQQQDSNFDRYLKIPIGNTSTVELPAAQEGYVLGWVGGKLRNLASATASLAVQLLSSVGATLITYLAPFIGAVGRLVSSKLSDSVSILDFGGVGDGVTNNTAAIAAAMANALATKKKHILFPAGNYVYTPPINIAQDGLEFIGEGIDATYLTPTATAANALDVGVTTNVEWFALRGINIVGNATCTNGIRIGSDDGLTCFGVKVYLDRSKIGSFGSGNGILLNRAWWVNIHATVISSCNRAIYLPSTARVSTVVVDGWSQIRHSALNAIDIRTDRMCDLFVVRDSDMSNNQQSVLALNQTTGCGSKILFENVYLEENTRKNSTPGYDAVGINGSYWQFDLLAGGTSNYLYAQVTIKDCHSGQACGDPTTGWNTGLTYAVGALVFQAGSTYKCLVAHTAGVFATDLAAAKWLLTGAATSTPNHYQLRADHTLLEISNSQGFGDILSTTANTRSTWINMGLQNGAGFFAPGGQGLGLLGTVTGTDWENSASQPGTYNEMKYASKGHTFKGHLGVRQDTKPTIAVGAAAGTGGSVGATVATDSTDTAGTFTVTNGSSGVATGIYCTVTFHKPFSRPPIVVITPASGNSAKYMSNNNVYVSAVSTGSFQLRMDVAPAVNDAGTWNYMVIE